MLVGVPKEIKTHEYRVGLTPESAREYVAAGHQVIVESGAGMGISKADDDYTAIGAEIVDSAEEVFARAEMVVKVKEPQPNEWVQLREGQILFTYLHLAPDPDQARGLMESGVSAVAYETVTAPDGSLPLLAPMSEVAGRLSIEASAHAGHANNGGRGILMGGVPGVLPAKVVVIGGGVGGPEAGRVAGGPGAEGAVP
ncbi:MAG TPA: alanine dehydrogenase, partial [Erythrobacter sp.]|nr:alanine dehydrogenase [Erythrobacter sp.]